MSGGPVGRSQKEAILRGFKLHPCADGCGFTPAPNQLHTMHADHRNPADKHPRLLGGSIRAFLHMPDISIGEFMDELLKCDLVCEACHKQRTNGRRIEDGKVRMLQNGIVPLPLKEWIEETTRTWTE